VGFSSYPPLHKYASSRLSNYNAREKAPSTLCFSNGMNVFFDCGRRSFRENSKDAE
jgi:hypothetical protein